MPSPWLTKEIGGADDLLLLALGEDDALRELARTRSKMRCSVPAIGIAAGRQMLAVGVEVDDRLARHAGVHRRLGDRRRHGVRSGAGRTAPG